MPIALRLAFVSGTRADFGLMKQSLLALHADTEISLEIVATAQHLERQYGETMKDIVDSGLATVTLDDVEMKGTSGSEMARAVAAQTQHLTAYLDDNRPDLLLLLGDRGEMLAAGLAAVFLGVPVAHFHGGDRSGTVDDQLRQAITSLSHYHFPATPGAKSRLLRMGEVETHIHMLGAPGLDEIREFTPDNNLYTLLGIDPHGSLATVLFHPVVQDADLASTQAETLVETLADSFEGTVVVLAPNSDAGSAQIATYYQAARTQLARKTASKAKFVWVTHLPRKSFLSLVAFSDVLVGNSSAGIIEAASLHTAVVNIGDRQNGRERNDSVFDCEITSSAITNALTQALAYKGVFGNLFDQGGCAERLPNVIKSLDLSSTILKKTFTY